MIKKSKKMYTITFLMWLGLCLFAILIDIELLRNMWFIIPFSIMLLITLGFTWYAIRLEEQGQ